MRRRAAPARPVQVPDAQEVADVLDWCCASEGGSHYPGMTYEQGVEEALRWMLGQGPNPKDDT